MRQNEFDENPLMITIKDQLFETVFDSENFGKFVVIVNQICDASISKLPLIQYILFLSARNDYVWKQTP